MTICIKNKNLIWIGIYLCPSLSKAFKMFIQCLYHEIFARRVALSSGHLMHYCDGTKSEHSTNFLNAV